MLVYPKIVSGIDRRLPEVLRRFACFVETAVGRLPGRVDQIYS